MLNSFSRGRIWHTLFYHFIDCLAYRENWYLWYFAGWKLCERWSVACPYCRNYQCFWPPRIYCQITVQGCTKSRWTGILCCDSKLGINKIHLFVYSCTHALKFFCLHQETLARVTIWCIGEYGELLVSNTGMPGVEDPVTVSSYFWKFFLLFVFNVSSE